MSQPSQDIFEVRRVDLADIRRSELLGEMTAGCREGARELAAMEWGGVPEDYLVRYLCSRASKQEAVKS
jgi:hypothetical protein